MEDAVIGRMRESFTERMRDMGLPEQDIPGRVCALMREVHSLAEASAAADEPGRDY